MTSCRKNSQVYCDFCCYLSIWYKLLLNHSFLSKEQWSLTSRFYLPTSIHWPCYSTVHVYISEGCTRLAAASDNVYQLLVHGRWFSSASSTTKAGRHDIAEILLKVTLNTKYQNQSIYFRDSMWSGSEYVHYFYHLFILSCRWRFSCQEERSGIPLISVTPPHLCACPKLGLEFPTSYGVCFVCSVNSVKMRSDCSFCWWWWNLCPSLFRRSFYNTNKGFHHSRVYQMFLFNYFFIDNFLFICCEYSV